MVGEVKRRAYQSPLRRIRPNRPADGCWNRPAGLFVDHGYAGTTVATVAEDAGVSPETIYPRSAASDLLEGSWTSPGLTTRLPMTTSGGQPSSAFGTRPSGWTRWWSTAAGSWLRRDRSTPSSASAADKEAFAAALGQRTILEERLASQTERIRRYLAEDLRPGLGIAEAGQRYCALAGPELYYVLWSSWAGRRRSTSDGSRNCCGPICSDSPWAIPGILSRRPVRRRRRSPRRS